MLDRTLDRRGSAADSTYRDSSASLRSLFSEACVFDVWRHLHPDISAFSWLDGMDSWPPGLIYFDALYRGPTESVPVTSFLVPILTMLLWCSRCHPLPCFIVARDAGSLTSLYYATLFLCLLSSPSGPLGGRGREVSDLFSCGGIGARSALKALPFLSVARGSRSR